MAVSQSPYAGLLRELATLMLAVSGESVTMIKRSAPEQALKMKKRKEWDLYLEFLKVMFNLADRLSPLYIPIQEQPHFMDSLEDAVTKQLQTMLAPALGPDGDEMEIVMTIGKAVAESRERYERFRFLATEDSKVKDEFLKLFGDRIAQLMDAPGNGVVTSAATLCASSVIGAMKALFDGFEKRNLAPEPVPGVASSDRPAGGATGNEIKLVSVMSTVKGEEVETRWGLHPRFRQDLKPEQAQELSQLMNRITQILGERYAAVAFSADWATWNRIGHA